jgi:hypothetical protein
VTFATPLGLLALLAIPAIVVIHLFRRRFPPRQVSGLFLWQFARQTPESGGRIARLPITTSLLLECLAALALALILAGARLSPVGVSQHLVVLLDDTASMAAINAAGESARDRAVRRVRDEIDRLPSAARFSIVLSGDRPAVLAGPAVVGLEARKALDAWTPLAPHHAMTMGLRLARELAGDAGRLIVLSDMPRAARGEANFEGGLWASVGEAAPNVGVTAAQRTIADDDRRSVVSLTLSNNAVTAGQRRLTISTGEQQVLAREVEVPPGSSSVSLPLPPDLPAVRVALADDALGRDNAVVLAAPKPRTVAVEIELPECRGRTALNDALAATPGVAIAQAGHLAFVDAATIDRARAADVWRVGFGRPAAALAAPGEPHDFIGPFVLEKRHAFLQAVTLGGVVWTGAVPLAPGVARPLVSAGDQILAGPIASPSIVGTAILFNLDLDRTNLVRSPDWPILISNIVEMRRQNLPGPERWNYRTGEWIRIRLDRDPKAALRFRCGGVERALPSAREIEFMAPSPGGLLQVLEGDEVLFEIGVNFLDEIETALRDQATSDVGGFGDAAGLRGETAAASDPLFWVLLVVAGAATLTNWCLLSPRRASSASLPHTVS